MNDKLEQYMKEVNRIVGERIYKKRIRLGMSRRELAAKAGVSIQQISKYESCKTRVSIGRLALIAKALNERMSYFYENMFGSEKMMIDMFAQKNNNTLHLDLIQKIMKIKNPQQLQILRKIINRFVLCQKN